MKKYIASFLLISLFWSCKETPKTDEKADETVQTPKSKAPSFNQDSAYLYIKNQVDFGPRVPNTDAHKKCSAFFVEKFKAFNWKVIEQDFVATAWDGTKLQSKNIIASYNPSVEKRILLASHWDSRPYADQEKEKNLQQKAISGANDGASGVGILMELARIINQNKDKPTVGIDIVLFDAEDYGKPEFAAGESEAEFWCLGSQHWSSHRHVAGYHAFYGVLLDMVGAKNAHFFREEGSVFYAESVVDKVWKKGQSLGYGAYFVDKPCGAITDDHYFVNKITGIKMIDIIQYNDNGSKEQFFGDYWHTHNDDLSVIDPTTLKAVGQTLLEVLYTE
jgi:glutaminyl-peptide cyclotransferase